jgi:hypothetical protein
MAMLPKLKLKALVNFPATVLGGTGIGITKTSGNFTVNLDYSEFAFLGSLPTGSNVLVWDPVSNVYTLVPPSATGGISDAPSDSLTYGRKNHAWVDAWASPVLTGNPTAPTPTAGDNDTSIATTAFVRSAVVAGGGVPEAPNDGVQYARQSLAWSPVAGGSGSGDVVGPAGAVADSIATFNGITGKIIKDGGKKVSDLATVASVPNSNVIINGDFRINQGGYVSAAVLAATLYGHDQWKAGASGGDYSFTQLKSSTQITIAAGKSLIQPIEDVNVVGGSYVLSWAGTAQARAGVNTLTPSGAYAASPLLITGQTAGTVMSVEFNTGTLGTVKLESGAVVTPFVMRDYATELATCQRYLQVVDSSYYELFGSGATTTATNFNTSVVYEKKMRAAATVTLGSAANYILALAGATFIPTGFVINTAGTSSAQVAVTSSGMPVGIAGFLQANASAPARVFIDARF